MNAREVITEELRRMGSFLPHDEANNIIYRLRIAGFVILSSSEVDAKDKEIAALREAMELARAVLAQSIAAGHNVPGPAPEEIEKAFWALDAALKEVGNERP